MSKDDVDAAGVGAAVEEAGRGGEVMVRGIGWEAEPQTWDSLEQKEDWLSIAGSAECDSSPMVERVVVPAALSGFGAGGDCV